MYIEAYKLLKEALNDTKLNEFIFNSTGKYLTVIDSGPQVTIPAAAIVFNGGEVSRTDNAMQTVEYDIAFALPYWGSDALKKCHDFLDVLIEALFSYEERSGAGQRNFILKVNPIIIEEDTEEKWWAVTVRVTVSIFYNF